MRLKYGTIEKAPKKFGAMSWVGWVYKPTIGSDISQVCEEVADLTELMSPIKFVFNDIEVVAQDYHTKEYLVGSWNTVRHAKSSELKDTVEETDKDKIIKEALVVIKEMPLIYQMGQRELIDWLGKFVKVADNKHVDELYSKPVLIRVLKSMGYKANEYAGHKFVEANESIMFRYIVGQVIECLDNNMPPSPIISKFIAQFKGMTDEGYRIS